MRAGGHVLEPARPQSERGHPVVLHLCRAGHRLQPGQKGIVKDIVGTSRMGFASGIVEMASILSLLIGQIGVFIWFRYLLEPSTDTIWHRWLGEGFFQWFDACLKPSGINDGWYAASFPCLVFLLLAVPVAASSFCLPRYAPGGDRPFSWSLFYEHFHQLGKLWKTAICASARWASAISGSSAARSC